MLDLASVRTERSWSRIEIIQFVFLYKSTLLDNIHNAQHLRKSIQKPKYQTVEWAIKTCRYFLVTQGEEEVQYITLPLRISQAIYPGDEQTTQPISDLTPAVKAQ